MYREVFVMSKCPDAEDGEATIISVMEKVGAKVALNFTYIATYTALVILVDLDGKTLLEVSNFNVCMDHQNV